VPITMDDPQTAAMEHRQAGGGVDRQWSTAMRCAAGERALFTADADCGTARQLQQGTQKTEIIISGRCKWGEGN